MSSHCKSFVPFPTIRSRSRDLTLPAVRAILSGFSRILQAVSILGPLRFDQSACFRGVVESSLTPPIVRPMKRPMKRLFERRRKNRPKYALRVLIFPILCYPEIVENANFGGRAESPAKRRRKDGEKLPIGTSPSGAAIFLISAACRIFYL